MLNILSWVFGFAGVGANVLIYHQKNRKNLLTAKLVSNIIWCFHYASICAWSGAAVCGISIAREIVFLNKEHNWAKSKLWLALFFACNFVSIFFTWKGVVSILPACCSMASIVIFWIGSPRLTRFAQIPISVSFLIYNTSSRSYMGILNEIFTLSSIFVSLIKQKRNNCREN